MKESNGSIIFWEMLLDTTISIPPIQRDYAQGRPSRRAESVRKAFAASLVSTLSSHEPLELHLDFVYGTYEGDVLRPIDGQQRLTTLFLLHWVLAIRAGQLQTKNSATNRERLARFRYDNRTTATEFLENLIGWEADSPESLATRNLADVISDQLWFHERWHNDPTVAGMIEMIRSIDSELNRYRSKGDDGHVAAWWNRLVEEQRVTFKILAVEELSPENPAGDDIYIKMNARGKPLTEWEQFKNWFEQHVDALNMPEYAVPNWKTEIDTRWTDLFWEYRDGSNYLIDEEILRFFRMMGAIGVAVDGEESRTQEKRAELIQNLFSDDFLPVTWYNEHKVYGPSAVDSIFRILQKLSAQPDGTLGVKKLNQVITGSGDRRESGQRFFVEDDLLGILVSRYRDGKGVAAPTLTPRMHIAALFLVLIRIGTSDFDAVRGWMRLFRNVIENPPRDRIDVADWIAVVKAIDTVLRDVSVKSNPYSNPDREVWDEIQRVFKRHERQVREEYEKASLENHLAEGADWLALFAEYEGHGFFRGRVLFARELSKNKTPAETRRILAFLSHVFAQPSSEHSDIWQPTGDSRYAGKELADQDLFLFRRALLVHGDYSFYKGSNWCLVDNSSRATARRLQWFSQVLQPDNPTDSGGRGAPALLSLFESVDVVGTERRLNINTIDQRLQREITNCHSILRRESSQRSRRWRGILANCPRCLWYSQGNNLRWETEDDDNPERDGPIFVLRSQRLSGEYVELITYALYGEITGPQTIPESKTFAYRKKTRKNPIPKIIWRKNEGKPTLLEAFVDKATPGFVTLRLEPGAPEEDRSIWPEVVSAFQDFADDLAASPKNAMQLRARTADEVFDLVEPFRQLTVIVDGWY